MTLALALWLILIMNSFWFQRVDSHPSLVERLPTEPSLIQFILVNRSSCFWGVGHVNHPINFSLFSRRSLFNVGRFSFQVRSKTKGGKSRRVLWKLSLDWRSQRGLRMKDRGTLQVKVFWAHQRLTNWRKSGYRKFVYIKNWANFFPLFFFFFFTASCFISLYYSFFMLHKFIIISLKSWQGGDELRKGNSVL